MNLKEKIEIWDTILSILQRVVVIMGVFAGLYLFFQRDDYKPKLEIYTDFIGVEDCFAQFSVEAKNIGLVPFTLRKAFISLKGNSFSGPVQADTLPQIIASGETTSIIVKVPVSNNYNDQIVNFEFTAKIAEDGDDIWRVWDQPIQFGSVSFDC